MNGLRCHEDSSHFRPPPAAGDYLTCSDACMSVQLNKQLHHKKRRTATYSRRSSFLSLPWAWVWASLSLPRLPPPPPACSPDTSME